MSLPKHTFLWILLAGIAAGVFSYGWYITRTVPNNFPSGQHFTVLEGESLKSVSVQLEEEGYIHSALWFRTWVSFLGRDKQVHLGVYTFESPNVLGYVVKKLTSGTSDMPLISLTVPEGSTSFEVATLIKKVLPELSVDIFGEKVYAHSADGKLFPSTYFLLPSTSEERIVEIMMDTFEDRYKVVASGQVLPTPLKNENDVISLAAILEGEAKKEEDMKLVAGILLRRLKEGMPLQVDVAPETYKSKGLPAQPINNPGEISLNAVFHPSVSEYLFYLTGKDGTMHYAKTFAEHKKNIQKYLK
jgi:UPF0755 protein